MSQKSQLTLKELQGYRDDLVNVLEEQHELLDKIADYLKERNKINQLKNTESVSKESVKSESGLSPERILEDQAIFQGEIQKLKNFDVVLAVVGTMKAGKSTTINAIVGREIMPNRNRPMTTLPTLIRHTSGKTEPELKFNPDAVNTFIGEIRDILLQNHDETLKGHSELKENNDLLSLIEDIRQHMNFSDTYHGEEKIFDFLKRLNDLARLAKVLNESLETNLTFPYVAYREFDTLPVIEVEFSYLQNAQDKGGRLALLDTPGPNEAKQPELARILTEQLKRCSAVLLVLDYGQLNSASEENIREQVQSLGGLDKSQLFALVNKFDEKDSNSDDKETTIKFVFNNLLEEKIEKDNIFTVSAKEAFLAHRIMNEIKTTGHKPALNTGWVHDFADISYGRRYAKLWDSKSSEEIQDDAQDILAASGMMQPITNAIDKNSQQSPLLAITSTLQKIKESFAQYNDVAEISKITQATEAEIEHLNKEIQEASHSTQAIKDIEKRIKSKINAIIEEESLIIKTRTDELQKTAQQQISNLMDSRITDYLKEEEEKLKEELKHTKVFLWNLNAKKKKELEELKRILNNGGRDELNFSSSQQKDSFTKAMTTILQDLAKSVNDDARDLVSKGYEKITFYLEVASSDCQEEVNTIRKNFSEKGLDLIIAIPPSINYKEINTDAVYYERTAKTYTKKERRESKEWYYAPLRWITFGNYGYDEIEVTHYCDSKGSITQHIYHYLEHNVFGKIRNNIESSLTDYSKNYIEQYISKVRDTVSEIVKEIEETIKISQANKTEIEALHRQVEDLTRQHEKIKPRAQQLFSVFGVSYNDK